MLAHIELRLELVVLQVVVLQLRLPPLHGQNIIGEIRVVNVHLIVSQKRNLYGLAQ